MWSNAKVIKLIYGRCKRVRAAALKLYNNNQFFPAYQRPESVSRQNVFSFSHLHSFQNLIYCHQISGLFLLLITLFKMFSIVWCIFWKRVFLAQWEFGQWRGEFGLQFQETRGGKGRVWWWWWWGLPCPFSKIGIKCSNFGK